MVKYSAPYIFFIWRILEARGDVIFSIDTESELRTNAPTSTPLPSIETTPNSDDKKSPTIYTDTKISANKNIK